MFNVIGIVHSILLIISGVILILVSSEETKESKDMREAIKKYELREQDAANEQEERKYAKQRRQS